MAAKKLLALVAVCVLVLFIFWLAVTPPGPTIPSPVVPSPAEPNGDGMAPLYVTVFGIGRADATVIRHRDYAVMIDTGENQHGAYLVNRLTEMGVKRLDYLIITHFDNDHVGGAHVIINYINVLNVVVPNYSRESRHVERFENAMQNANILPYVLTAPLHLTLGDASLMLDPSGLPYMHFPRVHEDDADDEIDEDEMDVMFTGDDFSIVTAVSHGMVHFLFTGDALNHRLGEVKQNEALMALNYTYLHIPRHGRHTRRSVSLIHALRPMYAVITGFHPDEWDVYYPARPADVRIINALAAVGASVFFTMSRGVAFVSDGLALRVL